ncbi:calmin-like isoform X3 [Acanthochromis polyacanthus]|uniref:calmin-like isoform X3 n=1 Tax=Acanthochromis polyacanthus TaxID=80966 RepID=UPI002233F5FA|nr:calmin-like isoform X3 [Acanthochromis polyacanthus]
MAGHGWEDWFEREEFIGQISDIRVQNLQVEREVVQKRTFTRWMNLHLEKCDPPIEIHDLFQDIQDGRILMALLEELSGCKLLHGFKKSSHRIFRLNNIAKVLSFLEERNVKLVSIDAADVADGNSSIILGLIWNIILFFQIKELTGNIRSQFPSSSSLSSIPTSSDSDTSYCSTPSDERHSASTAIREHSKAIKKLLQWVQKRTRKYGVAVQDFGKSWTSGLAFLAVIKSIDPTLVDMRRALLRSARENLEDAFRIAHYSLGIPRLLEPEDLTINTPDEQSIMTYVSQFLEHFPGKEEPERPSQVIERSISMGRLNFRDSDSDHMKNGSHRSRVKERSYMFQKDCAKHPPKILISSVSEDRSVMSPAFRMAAARSWSSEDFLSESPKVEDISSHALEDTREPAGQVLANIVADSPQLSYTHSPTSSSVAESVNTESVIGDSAISSPESWVESEFGVIPVKFCESRSDSSLCDSGTAWDVYRATPVEVTTLDEGFIPSMEDRATDDQSMTDSYTDEGVYSLSSLESTQGRIQGHSDKKQVEVLKDEKANHENHKQDLGVEHGPNQIETEVTNKKDRVEQREQINASQNKKDKVLKEQEPFSALCDTEMLAKSGAENVLKDDVSKPFQFNSGTNLPLSGDSELVNQNSVIKSSSKEMECLKQDMHFITQDHEEENIVQTETRKKRNNSEEVEVGIKQQKTDCPSEDKEKGSTNESQILKKMSEERVETQDEGKDLDKELLRDNPPDSQESNRLESCIPLESTYSTKQEGTSKTSLGPSMDINIPLISISTEPEEQDQDGISNQEGQEHADNEDLGEQRKPGTDKDVNGPRSPDELSYVSTDNESKILVEISTNPVSENVHLTQAPLKQTREAENKLSHDTDEDNIRCVPETEGNMERSDAKQECKFPRDDFQTAKDLVAQSSSTNTNTQLINTEQNMDTTGSSNGHQDKLADTFSDNETVSTQQNTLDPLSLKPQSKIEILVCEPDSMSRNMDLFYTDINRSSPTEDLVGDPIEPMDLFYPDKEEPMFAEPPDTEMQSWPSVLSVSPLQPAPASEASQGDQQLNLLGEDFMDGRNFVQDQDKVNVITKTNQESENASESQGQCLLPGEEIRRHLGDDVLANGSDLSEAEEENPDSARESTEPVRQNESQIPPVLRHRKPAHLSESMDNRRAAPRKADRDDSDWWRSEHLELYVLLLLWLLLYCFWVLPQMDLKTLPSLLLNLND